MALPRAAARREGVPGRRIVALNSLDERYGSTHRLRALGRLLERDGHTVVYREGAGHPLRRLLTTLGAAALEDYDLLLAQKFNPVTLPAIAVGRLRGRPVLVDWDDLDAGLQGGPLRRWLTAACETVGPALASAVTTHSEVILQAARRRGRAATLVRQGFEEELFRPSPALRAAARARYGFGAGDRVMGHLCTFTHGGALDLEAVLRAWSRVREPAARFLLIGGGPLEERVRRLLAAHGLDGRVRLTGLLPHDQVPAALAGLDVGVVYMSDTPANRARVSLKVLEYLAMDVPVAGRVVGETARRFGHLVTPAEVAELPRTLEQLAAAPAPATHDAVAAYRWDRIAGELGGAIASLLGCAGPDGGPCG